ncbi:MAG: hypothetical protein ACR2QB_01145 [Gammaproteobacteria bacterium]
MSADDLAAAFQDPLASISAVFSDNTISFDVGPDGDDEAYEFNLQPVYSLNFIDGVTIIPRAMIPIVGAKPGADLPRFPDDGIFDEPQEKGRQWGLSDIVTQFFVTPTGQEGWTWGAGPMISWKTRTDNDVKGAGGGAGLNGVLVGAIGPLETSLLVGHLWGFDGDFSVTTLQPMLYYNFESSPGWYVGYNNTASYDHKTDGNGWTVPLGLSSGKFFAVGERGHAADVGLGVYALPSWGNPRGGADYQLKFNVGWVFPR